MKFKFLSHTADLKIRVYGKNFKEIINNSLLALKTFFKPKLTKEKIEKKINIRKSEKNQSIDLLINFLSEVLAQTYIKKTIFLKFIPDIISENQIKGKILGYKFKEISQDIKAVTYHQAKLEKKGKKLIFEFIIDI